MSKLRLHRAARCWRAGFLAGFAGCAAGGAMAAMLAWFLVSGAHPLIPAAVGVLLASLTAGVLTSGNGRASGSDAFQTAVAAAPRAA